MGDLLTKRERVEFLLEHWTDFYETMHSHDRIHDSDGAALTLMPPMSRHPSVVELKRCVDLAKVSMPVRHSHMMAFYGAEWRTVTRQKKIRNPHGKLVMSDVRVRERIKQPWIRGQKVRDAVDFITAAFEGPVFIPAELLEEAA